MSEIILKSKNWHPLCLFPWRFWDFQESDTSSNLVLHQGPHSNCLFKKKFFVFSLFFSLSVNFSVLIYKICDSNIHKTALADISSFLKKLELSLHISYYSLPFESRSLQLEQTKFPMFWQNFRILFGFPDREFCGHFPCFPCAMRTMYCTCSTHVSCNQLNFPPGGGGGRGTDSLSLSTNCETTAPLFGQRTAPVLLPPNLQPPLFMDNQAQPLEISVKWCIFCITYIIFYQIIVLKGFKNKFECIQLLFDVEYWMQTLWQPPYYKIW